MLKRNARRSYHAQPPMYAWSCIWRLPGCYEGANNGCPCPTNGNCDDAVTQLSCNTNCSRRDVNQVSNINGFDSNLVSNSLREIHAVRKRKRHLLSGRNFIVCPSRSRGMPLSDFSVATILAQPMPPSSRADHSINFWSVVLCDL